MYPIVFFHCICFDDCILNCNECICLRLLSWHTPYYFFIASIFPTLGLHGYFPIRFNKYKDKDEDGGLKIPPYTMETDLVNTWHQDNVVISGDDAIVGMRQKRFSQKEAHTKRNTMKLQL